MIVCIEGVAMPPKWHGLRRYRDVEVFAYCREEREGELGDDSIQSANHALRLVKIVTGRNITEGEPPRTEGHTPMYVIEIQVTEVHRDTASYRVKYQKFDGCPLHVIKNMMEIHAAVKRVVRRIHKETKLEREMRKREKAAKRIGVTA